MAAARRDVGVGAYSPRDGAEPASPTSVDDVNGGERKKGERHRSRDSRPVADPVDDENARHFYRKGNKLYDQRKFAEAIEMYSLSIHADPKSADCYFNRGNAYRNLGRYEEAIQDYNRALSLSPKDVGAHVKKGVAYSFLKGDKFLLKAISCFTKAVALQPDCSEAFVRRGFAYKDLHDHEHALEDFNTCIRLGSGPNSKPKYVAEAFAGRAEILVREGRLLTALKDIERAIELNPKKYGT